MTRIDIRQVDIAESDMVAAIMRRAMTSHSFFDGSLHTAEEDRAFWREQVFPHCDVTGAYADATLIGQAVGRGWIHHFHIDPAWHGCGVGSLLLGTLQGRATDLQLWTFQANMGARRFYERHGFIAVEITDGQRNEEKLPDVRYRWLK